MLQLVSLSIDLWVLEGHRPSLGFHVSQHIWLLVSFDGHTRSLFRTLLLSFALSHARALFLWPSLSNPGSLSLSLSLSHTC